MAPWFYNNPWREPEITKIVWFPTLEKNIAQSQTYGGQVLEVGCGHGTLSLKLAGNGLAVQGTDLSPRSVAVAKVFKKRARFTKSDCRLEHARGDSLKMDSSQAFFKDCRLR